MLEEPALGKGIRRGTRLVARPQLREGLASSARARSGSCRERLVDRCGGRVAKRRRERSVRQLAAVELDALAAQNDHPTLARPTLDLAHEARLADPGLPGGYRNRRRATGRELEHRFKRGQLVPPLHHGPAHHSRRHEQIIATWRAYDRRVTSGRGRPRDRYPGGPRYCVSTDVGHGERE